MEPAQAMLNEANISRTLVADALNGIMVPVAVAELLEREAPELLKSVA